MRLKIWVFYAVALLCTALVWWAVIFLPPWNLRAVIYVVVITVAGVIILVTDEILWHRRNPEQSRRITEIELESRRREEEEKKRQDP